MGNFKRFGEMLVDKNQSWRNTAMTDEINGLMIDTCYAPDVEKWETGILKGKWIIVEEYEDEKEAKKGHEKWIKKIKENSNQELKVCRTAEEWFAG